MVKTKHENLSTAFHVIHTHTHHVHVRSVTPYLPPQVSSSPVTNDEGGYREADDEVGVNDQP